MNRKARILTIIYENNGAGISKEDKERIFRRGSGKGGGFGLFFSREILSLTGITINETGEQEKGARFEIYCRGGCSGSGKMRSVVPATRTR